ncbi:unnamed protein product [Penicillium roqueforti FM164]|uniref:Uncharacterized protein n=1 Tax=Penicillium roqueforti (strain FM164) TaxID=1365484 RepID=W6QR31_PENRF|nr:unnamed protein product [Penicillium roqueforti FM164]
MSQCQKGISLLFRHEGYYEIACSIMEQLTASDVGALLASLRITPAQHTVETFLQPLRDFDPTMRQFESWFQDKCQILIIGPDTIRLSDRIFNADEYYKGKRPSQTQLEVWIFAIPANFEKSAKEVQCLRHCSHASSLFSMQERAEALIAGQELLENNLIRQISYTDAEPSKVPGEYLDVKIFDLFSTTTHRRERPSASSKTPKPGILPRVPGLGSTVNGFYPYQLVLNSCVLSQQRKYLGLDDTDPIAVDTEPETSRFQGRGLKALQAIRLPAGVPYNSTARLATGLRATDP